MNVKLGFLRELNWTGFLKNHTLDQEDPHKKWGDLNRLETVICLEKVLNACYQTMGGMVHNLSFRNECQRFEKQAQHHQGALSRTFPLSRESEITIEDKLYQYQVQLSSSYLNLSAVINFAINLSAYKIDIYRELSLKDKEHRKLINQFLDDSKEEMSFLRRERNYHLNNSTNKQLEVLLN